MTEFIYAHHKTSAMLRSETKQMDIIRVGVTIFSFIIFIIAISLKHKTILGAMFTSDELLYSKFSKTDK